MSLFQVETVPFDSNIFGYNVGRLEIEENDLHETCNETSLQKALHTAYVNEVKLVYIYGPVLPSSPTASASIAHDARVKIPGLLVDDKVKYAMNIKSLNMSELIKYSFSNEFVRIKVESKSPVNTNEKLRQLSIASGEWSRFRIDNSIPKHVFESIFEAWINNSVNRSIADEVFVAHHIETGEDVGFITVSKKQDVINIGLLAVSDGYRRQGIANSLLSRAALWAIEQSNYSESATLTVVTQGANISACSCYEKFGFKLSTTQKIYHAWLPQHLEEPNARADKGVLPFCKQYFVGKEMEYVAQVFATGLDSASRFTIMCAAKLKDIMGPDCERIVMVPSGTAALEMACMLAGLEHGDEVILPSYTFSSTANAIVLRGAIPVFIDCRFDTVNIDEKLIEAAITPRTKAICCVHYAGIPCEMDTICDIAKRHSLYVIEDAAQGFLSYYKGRPVGTIGDFGCFSFHYTKNIICGEGGAISINRSPELARKALVYWEKGTNRYDFIAGKIDKYEWVDMGSSYVPSEVSCAILWAQLERCDFITNSRLSSFEGYFHRLEKLMEKGLVQLPIIPSDCKQNGHIFYMIVKSAEIRKELEVLLKKNGISAFSHYVPLHSAPAGKKFGRVGAGSEGMKVTADVFAGLVRLPMWTGLAPTDKDRIVEIIESYFENKI